MTEPVATTRSHNNESTTPVTIVLATANPGKIAELRHLLGSRYTIRSMDEFSAVAAEETGTTFEENAILKAEAILRQTGHIALADDSGLEVDALGGAPGAYSARYAGPDANDASNRRKLLENMIEKHPGERTARFVGVLALSRPGHHTITVRGECEGSVGFGERGTNGFGYDSLFVLPDGRTMAELEPAEKDRISHRALAMQKLIAMLPELLATEVP
jgi:XTP/dITP diphosphohydrolase